MNDSDALLFPLFMYLRKFGVPLGVGDYLLLLETLRAGKGLEDLESLKFTCSLLWAKSQQDHALLDHAFTLLVEPKLTPSPTSMLTLAQELEIDTDLPQRESSISPPKQGEKELGSGKVPPLLHTSDKSRVGTSKVTGTYHLTPRLPISLREMTSIWRYLREPKRSGPEVDLDVEGTLRSICRTGYFLRPVMQARRRNQLQFVMLIDRYGSMAPFTPLIDTLIESIRRSGFGHTSTYYFHNCPAGFLSPHPGLVDAQPIDKVLAEQAKGNQVLIVSDAGAARGSYRTARIACTRNFLKTISNYTYLYAWLNPLPTERWQATTAEDVAQMVPMFPLNRAGLIDTVNILRGHPFPPGVHLDAGS